MIVPCKFCEENAEYKPLPEMDKYNARVYFCDPCQAEYVFFRNQNKPAVVSLYISIHNKMYRWSKLLGDVVHLYEVKVPGLPGVQINKDLQLLKRFENVGYTMTPQNIKSKLEILLTFL